MSLGIAGPHRSGKTTLAEAISNETGMALVLTSAGDVCKSLGIDPSAPMNFATRMKLQHAILDSAVAMWQQERGAFVSDRTPIDFLGYTLADITMKEAASDVDWAMLKKYMGDCFEAMNRFFGVAVLLPPALPLVHSPEKPTGAMNRSYIEHLTQVMRGLVYDDRCLVRVFLLSDKTVDLRDRVDAVVGAMTKAASETAAAFSQTFAN